MLTTHLSSGAERSKQRGKKPFLTQNRQLLPSSSPPRCRLCELVAARQVRQHGRKQRLQVRLESLLPHTLRRGGAEWYRG